MGFPDDWEVLFLSHLPWQDSFFQRPHQFAVRLAKQLPVTYICPVSWRQLPPTGKLARSGKSDGVSWRHIAYTPFSGRRADCIKSTAKRAAKAALKGAQGRPKRIWWVQFPALLPGMQQHMRTGDILLCDVMDPFRQFANSFSHVHHLIEGEMAKADLIFTGGFEMRKDLPSNLAERAIAVPSGVDITHFSIFAKSMDLANMEKWGKEKKKIAGFVGHLDERLDWQLIQRVCEHNPDWHFEFLGNGQPPSTFRPPQNITLPGGAPYQELPARMKEWGVAMAPFARTSLGDQLSPTKIPEYLAAGLPVLSTRLPDIAKMWEDYCTLTDEITGWDESLKNFPSSIKQIDDTSLQSDLEAATWEARLGSILEKLVPLAENR